MRHRVPKRWGQHFLVDTNLLKKIVRIIDPQPHESVLEIGPGEGALTEHLAPRVKELLGVEIDRELFVTLNANKNLAHCRFINRDFLELDLVSLRFSGESVRVVGNIPYHITSPIIFRLLNERSRWRDIHLMVQREVADRLTAPAGNKSYGRLTVMVRAFMEVEQELVVPPDVFVPKPRVHSALVSLRPHSRFDLDDPGTVVFRDIVRLAFSQRRKMLKNSLGGYPLDRVADFDFTRRPETLMVSEFMDLARRFS